MELNICIPVLNRYDKLSKLIDSLLSGTLIPNIYIIDNGNKINEQLPNKYFEYLNIYSPGYNIGVAASWNWFIRNVPEVRLISNDDIVYGKDAMEKFLDTYTEDCMIFPRVQVANQFSSFIMPDKVIDQIGYFDESLSPNYGYFEDNDYSYRMVLKDICRIMVENITVFHNPSSTKEFYSDEELKEHHKKFKLAKENYIKKWGGTPEKEIYRTPYNE